MGGATYEGHILLVQEYFKRGQGINVQLYGRLATIPAASRRRIQELKQTNPRFTARLCWQPRMDCFTLRKDVTFDELKVEVEKTFGAIYWGIRNFATTSINNLTSPIT